MTSLGTFFGPNPWMAELVAFLFRFVPPASIATVVYVNANGNESDRPLAWAVGALLAGIGNFGWGSVVVGLLYHTVGE